MTTNSVFKHFIGVLTISLLLCWGCDSSEQKAQESSAAQNKQEGSEAPKERENADPFANIGKLSDVWVVDGPETRKLWQEKTAEIDEDMLAMLVDIYKMDMNFQKNTLIEGVQLGEPSRTPFRAEVRDGKLYIAAGKFGEERVYVWSDHGNGRVAHVIGGSEETMQPLVLVRKGDEPRRAAMREQYGKYSGLWKMDIDSLVKRMEAMGGEMSPRDIEEASALRMRFDFTGGEFVMLWQAEDGTAQRERSKKFLTIDKQGGFLLQIYDEDGEPVGRKYEWVIINDDTADFMFAGEPDSAQVIVRVK